MKKIFYMFALVVFTLASCEKNELDNNLQDSNTSIVVDNVNRPTRPIILGNQLNNPFSVENMQMALDSLMANSESLNGSMRAPSTLNEFEITATDLYIRYLPKDSLEYRTLKNDTTLTLFDFPLDYELKQVGDYYKDPTVVGEYTWLYTRVPVGYTPHAGIKYEVLDELFILEHCPYYSIETETVEDGMQKVKSSTGQNYNEALRVLQTVSFYLTGNLKQDNKDKDTFTNKTSGMQKVHFSVTIKLFGKTITLATYYFPSGTIKVNNSSATAVPVKGVEIFFWSWFKWNSVYTDVNGNYISDTYYDSDPQYYIVFHGENGSNNWNFDRVIFGAVCLWSQKHGMGAHDKDGYSTTIDNTSGAWDACITNNAFYDYMTICDNHGITRPPVNLKVALLEMAGNSSAPLLQNHLNTAGAGITAGLVAITIVFPGAVVVTVPLLLLDGAIATASPDIILAGGNIEKFQTEKNWLFTESQAISHYTSTIWHELSHCSNFQRVNIDKGYTNASLFWSSLISTEVTSFSLSNSYGSKGDINWEQVALCEGWAVYRSYLRMANNLLYYYAPNHKPDQDYPGRYGHMFDALRSFGCSDANIEKCLTVKSFTEFKQNLKNIYADNPTICANIEQRVTYFYNN